MNPSRKKYFFICVFAVAIIALVGLFAFLVRKGGIFTSSADSNGKQRVSLDTLIDSLEQRLQRNPDDEMVYIFLADAYLQKVRETADVAYYKKIDDAMEKAEKINKDNPEIYAIRATVALGRHHFADAKALGEKLIEIAPQTPRYYGILADAYTELGRYDDAESVLQKMVNIRPDFSSFSRISYLRELHGDIKGAQAAMEEAIKAGAQFPENIAWAYTELGKLYLRSDTDRASQLFEKALATKPLYPQALEGLGMTAFIKKDIPKAEESFMKAYEQLPIAQFTVNLGNLSLHQGNQSKAQQYYTLAQIAFEKSSASGVDTDLEYALFLADHDKDLPLALQKATVGYKNRPGISGADTLAWALYKNGKYEEAGQMIAKAMVLGDTIPSVLFHAGLIEEKLGHPEKARSYFKRANTLYPYFSIQYHELLQQKLQ